VVGAGVVGEVDVTTFERICDWRGGMGYLLACGATIPAGWLAIWLFGRAWG
jgi:hypothetical protein